jgi:hypothetical protein
MTHTKDEALDKALEALQIVDNVALIGSAYTLKSVEEGLAKVRASMLTIEQALAAPTVQEPDHSDQLTIAYMSGVHRGKELAAHRPWVGLTEQERNDIEDYCEMIVGKPAFEAIEAKLKERNT